MEESCRVRACVRVRACEGSWVGVRLILLDLDTSTKRRRGLDLDYSATGKKLYNPIFSFPGKWKTAVLLFTY